MEGGILTFSPLRPASPFSPGRPEGPWKEKENQLLRLKHKILRSMRMMGGGQMGNFPDFTGNYQGCAHGDGQDGVTRGKEGFGWRMANMGAQWWRSAWWPV